MKKQFLLSLTVVFTVALSGMAQNSYQSTSSLKWYTKAVQAFDNNHYALAKEYFKEVQELETQESIALEKYKLLTALELNEKNAGKHTELYLNKHPNSIDKTALILALSNYYFANKQNEKALEWFQKIDVKALTNKQETNYNYKLAFANYKTKNYTKAKEYLLPISKSGAYQNEAHYYLGSIGVQNKDYASASFHFDKIKNIKKYHREASYQLLIVSYQQKKYEEVIRLGERYYEETSGIEQSETAKIIGESYFYLGNYNKAIDYLTQYKGRQRRLTEVDYYFLGYAYYKLKEYDKAIENFNKITDEKSGVSQNAHYHLGDCYLKKNQKTQALNAFKNASEMEFDVTVQQDAFLNYAKLSYEIGNPYQSSSEVLQAFVDKYPNAEQASAIEGLIVNAYLQLKDFKGALAYYNSQRLVKDAQYQELLLERGFELYNENKIQEALSYFSKASELYNNKTITNRALFWKAEMLSELNNYKEADYYYTSFVKETNNKKLSEYADGVYGLAYALFHQKKYNDALNYFTEYTKISNNTIKKRNAVLRIADCHFVNKTYWSALENYNQVIKANQSQVDYAMHQKALAYGFLGKNEQKKATLKEIQTQFTRSAYLDDSYYQLGNMLVNQNKNKEAIEVFDELIKKYPKSPLVVKAKLKKGIVLFNSNENQESVTVLRDLVSNYPGTGEAVQAVKMAEQVYKEMDKVDEYAAWVKKLEFVNISDQDIDRSMFEAAENKYLANDLKAAITSSKKYLINFPQGIHALTVHFYLAQAYFNSGNKENAVPEYKEVLKVNANEYTEVALNRLSQIYLEKEEWELASTLLLQIETDAINTQNVVYAQSNLMKFYYKENKFAKALDYTKKVLGNNKSSEQAVADAYVYGARSAIELDDFTKAKNYYKELENIGKGSVKAEANYYKAFFLNKDKSYQKSNEQIQILASKYQAYRFWGVKGLLLMAQNFHALKDDFQANFILNNIISNVKEYDDLVEEAKELLQEYKPQNAEEELKGETQNNATNNI
ncbi:tetratricopeptide (TPR) repeat protein [Wenyingzhuangia heitensis]|uniref:Tetratricopeptide (TPR) repeat protein n=1 Tax=Wenyingzhuangia heitensis TaxID=1487859 RepID=A0ABX0U5G0_9FLAO|nr:tetratricopeptide repeat protein [Wenyingzhuangia heitensis]NIJ44100.1 tetratricopeptide (TPR) repeat protein [Wenyingzhuangia heitensis]